MINSQLSTSISEVGSRHPRKVALLRIGIGLYLLAVTVVLAAADVGGLWAWVTGGFAIVHFSLAYRLLGVARRRRGPSPIGTGKAWAEHLSQAAPRLTRARAAARLLAQTRRRA